MEKNVNVINWFEIPVTDMARARKFYETVLGISLPEHKTGDHNRAFFPYEQGSGKISGALIHGPGFRPSQDGTLVYFNCHPDLSGSLSRVEKAGGKITMPRTEIGPGIGFMAFFTDTEGNRVALHSMK